MEDHLVPLAFTLVECENVANWEWFIHLIRVKVIGPDYEVCVISDRHANIMNAVVKESLGNRTSITVGACVTLPQISSPPVLRRMKRGTLGGGCAWRMSLSYSKRSTKS